MQLRKLSAGFSSGVVGALVFSVLYWLSIHFSLTNQMGIFLTVPGSWRNILAALYPCLVWGGIFGLLFLLPWLPKYWWVRGVLFSLIPTVIMLIYYIPQVMDGGMFGVSLGKYTFAFFVAMNAIWGLVASFWYKKASA